MFKTIVIFAGFLLRISAAKLIGNCNHCLGSNKVACLDENHFSICIQGSVTKTITKCPPGYVCTDDELICRPSVEGYTPICYNDYCEECEITHGIFACIDATTYGYCFGANTPLKSTWRSCPSGYVCNYNYREICVHQEAHTPSCPANMTTTEANTISTHTTTTETTTISSSVVPPITTTRNPTTTTAATTLVTEISAATEPTTTQEIFAITDTTINPEVLDANTICAEIGLTGYFKLDGNICRRYVYCYPLSGQYLGLFYSCEFYFNDATKACQNRRPPNCVEHRRDEK